MSLHECSIPNTATNAITIATNSTLSSSTTAVATSKKNLLEGPCYLKVLVNNLVAGSIIGKNGVIITQIEQETGATLKLSPSNSFFPGTQERIVILSGQQQEVNSALIIILDKIRGISSQYSTTNPDGSNIKNQGLPQFSGKLTFKIVVPKSSVSAIIGKAGQQIKDLQESTGTKIRISTRDDGLDERLVVLNGTYQSLQNAALAICLTLQADPNLKEHMYLDSKLTHGINVNTIGGISHGIVGGVSGTFGASGQYIGSYDGSGPYNHPRNHQCPVQPHLASPAVNNSVSSKHSSANDILNHLCEIIVQIPDRFIGPIIGRNGICLTEIVQNSGARVQISQKGDLIPGTNDRKCVISGTVASVHAAHIMMLQRKLVLESMIKSSPGNALNSIGGNSSLSLNNSPDGIIGNINDIHNTVGQIAQQHAQSGSTLSPRCLIGYPHTYQRKLRSLNGDSGGVM